MPLGGGLRKAVRGSRESLLGELWGHLCPGAEFPAAKPVSLVIGESGKKPLAGPGGFPGAAGGAAALRRDPAAEDECSGGAMPRCPQKDFRATVAEEVFKTESP